VSQSVGGMLSRPGWKKTWTFNATCQVWQALYISIVLVGLLPFQCYTHPNGESSLTKFPAVVCGTSQHAALFVAGVLATVVYGVGFFSMCVIATLKAPAQSATNDTFVRFFRFLLYRFRVDRWYWGTVLMVRSFLMALTPIVLPDLPNEQLVMYTTVLVAFFYLQCYVMPWKSKLLNCADMMVMAMLVLVATAGGVYPEPTTNDSMSTFIIVILCGAGCAVFSIFASGVRSLINNLFKSKKQKAKVDQVVESVSSALPRLARAVSTMRVSELNRLMSELGEFDKRCMEDFTALMAHELEMVDRLHFHRAQSREKRSKSWLTKAKSTMHLTTNKRITLAHSKVAQQVLQRYRTQTEASEEDAEAEHDEYVVELNNDTPGTCSNSEVEI